MRKILSLIICLIITIVVSGCARKPISAADPYENFNRVMFAFNQDIDHLVYRPVSKVYRTIIPPPLKRGISNFFDNIAELTTLPNDILQGKIKYVFVDIWRFAINSTFGIGGLFDVASKVGLPKHYEDFGMTLAYWSGGTKSPYLMIPFIGPSTFRTGYSLPFDLIAAPWPYLNSTIGWAAFGLKYVNVRTKFLDSDTLVDNAFDPYIFVRNAYLQHREAQIKANMTNGSNHRLQRSPRLYRAPNGGPFTAPAEEPQA